MAILHNPNEKDAPSKPSALKKFIWAGQKLGIHVELVTKDDFGRLSEFDALFIRETTSVNDHTFRFARYAEAEGLVVIDDPQSIIRCANKVYLAELMAHEHIPTPKTVIVHKDNVDLVTHQLDLPCILKQPDSSFSAGVVKVHSKEELEKQAMEMLEGSELIIAQEYLPTEYDWRIGVLEHRVLYACRYYMAKNHWQIIRRDRNGCKHEGLSDTLHVDEAPSEAVRLALKATRPIGSGFYGVDIKQIKNKFYVIEVNDNPNIDTGVEDEVLKNELYLEIMRFFRRRIELRSQR
jgi:glutathione synthase/RimK-type ligase-like ATP-grasp enzyme